MAIVRQEMKRSRRAFRRKRKPEYLNQKWRKMRNRKSKKSVYQGIYTSVMLLYGSCSTKTTNPFRKASVQ
jgi:ribosomal protein L32E